MKVGIQTGAMDTVKADISHCGSMPVKTGISHSGSMDTVKAGISHSGSIDTVKAGISDSGSMDTVKSGISHSGFMDTVKAGISHSGSIDTLKSGISDSGSMDTVKAGISHSGSIDTLKSGISDSGSMDTVKAGISDSGPIRECSYVTFWIPVYPWKLEFQIMDPWIQWKLVFPTGSIDTIKADIWWLIVQLPSIYTSVLPSPWENWLQFGTNHEAILINSVSNMPSRNL